MPSIKACIRVSDVQYCIARSWLRPTPPLLLQSRSRGPFQGQEDLGPQLTGFPNVVSQADVRHACLWTASHGFELGDHVFQSQSFARSLGTTGFEHGVHDVDVEVVVGWLVYSLLVAFMERDGKKHMQCT